MTLKHLIQLIWIAIYLLNKKRNHYKLSNRHVLQIFVVALSGGLCVWGDINLLKCYGQDNPSSNAHVR